MKLATGAIAAAIAALAVSPAEARGFGRFGNEDNFHKVADITIPAELAGELPEEWANHAELDVHTITHWLGGGAWLEDAGYAIRVPAADKYWKLDADKVKALQDLKILPDPLPKREIPLMDYVFGYSLWIVIAVLALWYGGRALLKQKAG